MDKPAIIQFIRARLKALAETCKAEMQQAQADANSEEKSSAGDKYETARAMGQNQRDLFARRLDAALLELAVFDALSNLAPSDRIQAGNLVKAGNHYFFVGSGLGPLSLPSVEKLICTSTDSPLGKILIGKKPGDEFQFARQILFIEKVL